jgi:hypothetical protein
VGTKLLDKHVCEPNIELMKIEGEQEKAVRLKEKDARKRWAGG